MSLIDETKINFLIDKLISFTVNGNSNLFIITKYCGFSLRNCQLYTYEKYNVYHKTTTEIFFNEKEINDLKIKGFCNFCGDPNNTIKIIGDNNDR